jgi:hypothetical protein
VAGRNFANTGSRAIHPRPRNDIVSLQGELCAVVMYRVALKRDFRNSVAVTFRARNRPASKDTGRAVAACFG